MRFLQSKTYQFKLIAADKKNPDGRTFFLSSKKEDIRDAWYGELKKVVGTKGSKAVEATEKDGHKDTKEMTEEERAVWESDRAKAAAELFEEFDKNHDGVLDEGEQMMMARLLAEGDAGDRKALVDKLHEADHNHDGKLGAPLDCLAARAQCIQALTRARRTQMLRSSRRRSTTATQTSTRGRCCWSSMPGPRTTTT